MQHTIDINTGIGDLPIAIGVVPSTESGWLAEQQQPMKQKV